ncbi:unnamed protein product [Amoebophrya sp. A120]|nr:unnamed protein product [Amoebophrya sp. A120]|eukprot:GSA120T00012006001.1
MMAKASSRLPRVGSLAVRLVFFLTLAEDYYYTKNVDALFLSRPTRKTFAELEDEELDKLDDSSEKAYEEVVGDSKTEKRNKKFSSGRPASAPDVERESSTASADEKSKSSSFLHKGVEVLKHDSRGRRTARDEKRAAPAVLLEQRVHRENHQQRAGALRLQRLENSRGTTARTATSAGDDLHAGFSSKLKKLSDRGPHEGGRGPWRSPLASSQSVTPSVPDFVDPVGIRAEDATSSACCGGGEDVEQKESTSGAASTNTDGTSDGLAMRDFQRNQGEEMLHGGLEVTKEARECHVVAPIYSKPGRFEVRSAAVDKLVWLRQPERTAAVNFSSHEFRGGKHNGALVHPDGGTSTSSSATSVGVLGTSRNGLLTSHDDSLLVAGGAVTLDQANQAGVEQQAPGVGGTTSLNSLSDEELAARIQTLVLNNGLGMGTITLSTSEEQQEGGGASSAPMTVGDVDIFTHEDYNQAPRWRVEDEDDVALPDLRPQTLAIAPGQRPQHLEPPRGLQPAPLERQLHNSGVSEETRSTAGEGDERLAPGGLAEVDASNGSAKPSGSPDSASSGNKQPQSFNTLALLRKTAEEESGVLNSAPVVGGGGEDTEVDTTTTRKIPPADASATPPGGGAAADGADHRQEAFLQLGLHDQRSGRTDQPFPSAGTIPYSSRDGFVDQVSSFLSGASSKNSKSSQILNLMRVKPVNSTVFLHDFALLMEEADKRRLNWQERSWTSSNSVSSTSGKKETTGRAGRGGAAYDARGLVPPAPPGEYGELSGPEQSTTSSEARNSTQLIFSSRAHLIGTDSQLSTLQQQQAGASVNPNAPSVLVAAEVIPNAPSVLVHVSETTAVDKNPPKTLEDLQEKDRARATEMNSQAQYDYAEDGSLLDYMHSSQSVEISEIIPAGEGATNVTVPFAVPYGNKAGETLLGNKKIPNNETTDGREQGLSLERLKAREMNKMPQLLQSSAEFSGAPGSSRSSSSSPDVEAAEQGVLAHRYHMGQGHYYNSFADAEEEGRSRRRWLPTDFMVFGDPQLKPEDWRDKQALGQSVYVQVVDGRYVSGKNPVPCRTLFQVDCDAASPINRASAAGFCPPECPFVQIDHYFSCLLSCVAKEECGVVSFGTNQGHVGARNPTRVYGNNITMQCEACPQDRGCLECPMDMALIEKYAGNITAGTPTDATAGHISMQHTTSGKILGAFFTENVISEAISNLGRTDDTNDGTTTTWEELLVAPRTCLQCQEGYTLLAGLNYCMYNAYASGVVISFVMILLCFLVGLLFYGCCKVPGDENYEYHKAAGLQHRGRLIPRPVENPNTYYSFFKTRIHSENIAGPGFALYFNSLIGLFVYALVSFLLVYAWLNNHHAVVLMSEMRKSCADFQSATLGLRMHTLQSEYAVNCFDVCCLLTVWTMVYTLGLETVQRYWAANFQKENACMPNYVMKLRGFPPDAVDPSEIQAWLELEILKFVHQDEDLDYVRERLQQRIRLYEGELQSDEEADQIRADMPVQICYVSIAYDVWNVPNPDLLRNILERHTVINDCEYGNYSLDRVYGTKTARIDAKFFEDIDPEGAARRAEILQRWDDKVADSMLADFQSDSDLEKEQAAAAATRRTTARGFAAKKTMLGARASTSNADEDGNENGAAREVLVATRTTSSAQQKMRSGAVVGTPDHVGKNLVLRGDGAPAGGPASSSSRAGGTEVVARVVDVSDSDRDAALSAAFHRQENHNNLRPQRSGRVFSESEGETPAKFVPHHLPEGEHMAGRDMGRDTGSSSPMLTDEDESAADSTSLQIMSAEEVPRGLQLPGPRGAEGGLAGSSPAAAAQQHQRTTVVPGINNSLTGGAAASTSAPRASSSVKNLNARASLRAAVASGAAARSRASAAVVAAATGVQQDVNVGGPRVDPAQSDRTSSNQQGPPALQHGPPATTSPENNEDKTKLSDRSSGLPAIRITALGEKISGAGISSEVDRNNSARLLGTTATAAGKNETEDPRVQQLREHVMEEQRRLLLYADDVERQDPIFDEEMREARQMVENLEASGEVYVVVKTVRDLQNLSEMFDLSEKGKGALHRLKLNKSLLMKKAGTNDKEGERLNLQWKDGKSEIKGSLVYDLPIGLNWNYCGCSTKERVVKSTFWVGLMVGTWIVYFVLTDIYSEYITAYLKVHGEEPTIDVGLYASTLLGSMGGVGMVLGLCLINIFSRQMMFQNEDERISAEMLFNSMFILPAFLAYYFYVTPPGVFIETDLSWKREQDSGFAYTRVWEAGREDELARVLYDTQFAQLIIFVFVVPFFLYDGLHWLQRWLWRAFGSASTTVRDAEMWLEPTEVTIPGEYANSLVTTFCVSIQLIFMQNHSYSIYQWLVVYAFWYYMWQRYCFLKCSKPLPIATYRVDSNATWQFLFIVFMYGMLASYWNNRASLSENEEHELIFQSKDLINHGLLGLACVLVNLILFALLEHFLLRNLDSVFGHSAELNPTEYDAVERADSYSYLNTNPGMVLKSWFGLDETQFQYCGENKLDNAWRYKDLKLYSMGKEYLYDQRHNRGQRVFLEYWTGQEHEEAWNLLVTCCWPCHNYLRYGLLVAAFLVILLVFLALLGFASGFVALLGGLYSLGSFIFLCLFWGTLGYFMHDDKLYDRSRRGKGVSRGTVRRGRFESGVLVGQPARAGDDLYRASFGEVLSDEEYQRRRQRKTQWRERDQRRTTVADYNNNNFIGGATAGIAAGDNLNLVHRNSMLRGTTVVELRRSKGAGAPGTAGPGTAATASASGYHSARGTLAGGGAGLFKDLQMNKEFGAAPGGINQVEQHGSSSNKANIVKSRPGGYEQLSIKRQASVMGKLDQTPDVRKKLKNFLKIRGQRLQEKKEREEQKKDKERGGGAGGVELLGTNIKQQDNNIVNNKGAPAPPPASLGGLGKKLKKFHQLHHKPAAPPDGVLHPAPASAGPALQHQSYYSSMTASHSSLSGEEPGSADSNHSAPGRSGKNKNVKTRASFGGRGKEERSGGKMDNSTTSSHKKMERRST